MKQPVLLAVLALAGLATAQRGMQMQPQPQPPAPMHQPLPGMPMTAPPVDHPALAAQPLFQRESKSKPVPAPAPAEEPAKKVTPPVDPDTVGPKIAGKDLRKAVKAVAGLNWSENLFDARADSAASGKPILMIQALGEIDDLA